MPFVFNQALVMLCLRLPVIFNQVLVMLCLRLLCAEPHAMRLKKIIGFCGFLWVFWQSKASRIWFAQKTVKYKPWPAMEKIIADIIGVHPMEIWPSRYKADGSSVGYGIRQKRGA